MRLAPLIIIVAFAAGDAAAAPTTRVCFTRSKDEGAMNRHAVRLWGEQSGRRRKLVELTGGAKSCVRLPTGTWSFEARSSRLGALKGADPDECRSAPLVVEVNKSEAVNLSVAPLGRGATYLCGWDIT